MNLTLQTIKSFNKKERLSAFMLLGIFTISLISIVISKNDVTITKQRTYTEALVGELQHINPLFTEFSEADADVSSLVFSGLVKYNPDTKTFEEDLATHTLSEDKLVYTFTLKNDLKWQDGQPISSDDIYYTFAEVIQSPDFNNPILKSNFDGVKIEKTNSRTLTFTLSSPNSFFFTAMTVGILPKHILETVPVAELDVHDFNKLPVGSGPYRVMEPYTVDPNGVSTITLEQSTNYYGEKGNIEAIKFVVYPTINELISNRSSWLGAARLKQSLLGEIDLSDLNIYEYSLPQYTALFINTDSQKLTKNKTRLAISKAIDKSKIIATIGDFKQIDTPLLELNQSDWLHSRNLEESMGALHDEGWDLVEGEKYRKNSDGEVLSLKLVRRDFSDINPPQEAVASQSAELIKEQLAEVGIEVTVEKYNAEEIQTIISKRDFDLLLYGQSLGYNLDTFSFWHSSQVNANGLNLSNYQNPKADFYIESIRTTFDPVEKQELLNSLAQVIVTDVPAVFLYTPTYSYVIDNTITGLSSRTLLQTKDRFYDIHNWIMQ